MTRARRVETDTAVHTGGRALPGVVPRERVLAEHLQLVRDVGAVQANTAPRLCHGSLGVCRLQRCCVVNNAQAVRRRRRAARRLPRLCQRAELIESGCAELVKFERGCWCTSRDPAR